jgi:tRNA A37 N6-isopentenylltransferase MiaA
MKITKKRLMQIIENVAHEMAEEGLLDKIKKAVTPKEDTRSTIQKIADHNDMYKLGPARKPIVMALANLPEEELQEILILLNSVPGALAR